MGILYGGEDIAYDSSQVQSFVASLPVALPQCSAFGKASPGVHGGVHIGVLYLFTCRFPNWVTMPILHDCYLLQLLIHQ